LLFVHAGVFSLSTYTLINIFMLFVMYVLSWVVLSFMSLTLLDASKRIKSSK
jgi:biopolymer transport protein ExbB/TolQ